ncbi:MAG: imidazole glycerol phosphate synthase subunit HisH [Desulfobacterales bacterium]|nr:imidazole glycerol phosphate synthase subunit HisH [Desulfobacterales bacterium]
MIAIIDYDAGNLTSVARAVTYLGFPCMVTSDKAEIERSERIIFPGVGAAGSAMQSLKRLGLDNIIASQFHKGKPVLGICLGTQIIMGHSDENQVACLGLMDGSVRVFSSNIQSKGGGRLKIPHMGWNRIHVQNRHPLLDGVDPDAEFYFVHSYYPEPADPADIIATTQYGISFASVMGIKNLVATQFHPEKSGQPGLAILKNFCRWNPSC